MASDIEILMKAKEKEEDPRRVKMGWKSWEFHTVEATKDDINRLLDNGYIVRAETGRRFTKYLLTEKGRSVVWSASRAQEFDPVSRETIMDGLSLVVGFDDIKEQLAYCIEARKRTHFLLEGPPACCKSVMLEVIRTVVPDALMVFGSRTSGKGLSDLLFEKQPRILLMDEADKMRHDVFSLTLGLMEAGEIINTKQGDTRGIKLDCMIIAACNSSKKMPPEFLSRFAFHPIFQHYTRQEFVDVVRSMLSRSEGCPPDLAEMIACQVFDNRLGDVRQARGIWQLMREPTEEEAIRVLSMKARYNPDVPKMKLLRQETPQLL